MVDCRLASPRPALQRETRDGEICAGLDEQNAAVLLGFGRKRAWVKEGGVRKDILSMCVSKII